MKAIIYGAKSSPDERGSIEGQLDECRDYAERQGWEVVEPLYSDEAKSAYSGNRGQGLTDAKAHAARLAAEGEEVTLLVAASDRLARGDAEQADHLVEVWLAARRGGYKLDSVSEDLSDLLYVAVSGDRNHRDSAVKSGHVRRGVKRQVEEGRYLGSRRPYGYLFSGERKERRLILAPEEAAVVLRMVGWYERGAGYCEITERLDEEGIAPPGRPGFPPGPAWDRSTVANIIRSPIIAGLVHRKGETHPGRHEPIIDPERWARLQEIRESRRGKGRRPVGGHVFVRGILRCPECRNSLRPRTTPKGHAYYECRTRRCPQSSIDARVVEGLILQGLVDLIFDPEETRARIEAVASGERERADAMIAAAEKRLRAVERKRARAQGDYLDGKLSAALYEAAAATLDEEEAQAQAHADELREAAEQAQAEADDLDAEREVVARLERLQEIIRDGSTSDRAIVREAISASFERIYLAEGENGALAVIPQLRREAVAALRDRPVVAVGYEHGKAQEPKRIPLPASLTEGRQLT